MSALNTTDWHAAAAGLQLPRGMLIDGETVKSSKGAGFDVVSPRDGSVVTSLQVADTADLDRAVAAARKAFDSGVWRNRKPAERKKVLLRLAELIDRDRAQLALMDSLSMGAPIAMTHDHCVQWAIDCFRWYGEAIDKIYDEIAPTGAGIVALIRREPIGVVGLVLPWNWPAGMLGWKVPPALASGNSVVLKPDEQSSLSALRIAELALEAGVPPGVFNVVTGGPALGEAIGRHRGIDAIAFTGSTTVGHRFLRYSGESNGKPVWLELGGKSPNIIFDDAPDVDAAAQAAAFAIFLNSGQVCAAGSRLLVHNSIVDRVLDKLKQTAGLFAPNDPLSATTLMGPLAKREQYDRVLSYIDIGKQEGAVLAAGGAASGAIAGGYYVEPTIFRSVKNDMRIAREEIFGPVLSVVGFDREEEAIRIANDTEYGLAAAVWTANLARAHRVSDALRAGTVSVNVYGSDAPEVTVPFGGYKGSGFGRDKSLHAFDKYTQLKTVWISI
jgi:gamma-glutamyl-gamma-aminobutyraldehyde dehydrogenase/4-guanidinobutyraldehyde dehydrogenase/NAD-dependent aldehyde dehydrogenase